MRKKFPIRKIKVSDAMLSGEAVYLLGNYCVEDCVASERYLVAAWKNLLANKKPRKPDSSRGVVPLAPRAAPGRRTDQNS